MGECLKEMRPGLLFLCLCASAVVVSSLQAMSEPTVPSAAPKGSVNVFWRGQQDVEGTVYPCIRIPSILYGSNGGVEAYLAFAECRRNTGDGCYPDGVTSTGKTDICMRTSSDDGKTWKDLTRIVADAAQPTVIWDATHEKAILQFNQDGHIKQTVSTNLGTTWSTPTVVDASFPAGVVGTSVGPGTGLQLSGTKYRGRNLFIGHHGAYQQDYIWYSDDGEDYEVAKSNLTGMDEGTLAELPNGYVIANMRNKAGHRGVSLSGDGGESWSEVHLDSQLPDPVCEGSIVNNQDTPDLYFSGPGTTHGRVNGTIFYSSDGAAQWQPYLTVNPGGPFAYSCLSAGANADSVALLWETSTTGCSASSNACNIVYSSIPAK